MRGLLALISTTHLVTTVVYFNVVSVDVDLLILVVEDRGRTGVTRVASHVVCNH